MASWADLPPEVLIFIFDQLSFPALAASGLTSKSWAASLRCNWLWHRRCQRRWALHTATELAVADARGMDGRWRGLFYLLEKQPAPFTVVQLRVGDRVDCLWGDTAGQHYKFPRLGGLLQGCAYWGATVIEIGGTEPVEPEPEPEVADAELTQYVRQQLQAQQQQLASATQVPLRFLARNRQGTSEGEIYGGESASGTTSVAPATVRVHYLGYEEGSPWAREWVEVTKLRPTAVPDWYTTLRVRY